MRFKLIETFLTEGKNIDRTFEQYKDKIIHYLTTVRPYFDTDENPTDEDYKDAWIKLIISHDPTYKKGSNTTGDFGVWLTNIMSSATQKISFKDITPLLTEFIKKKPNLEKKDINQYSSYEELKQALDRTPFSKKQIQRRLQNIKNISPDDLIFQGDDWSVFSPSSYDSSCALRKGASWCTGTTENDHHYKQYTSNGKIYVIINNENPSIKYQAYVPNGKHLVKEFRDLHNSSVSFHNFIDENQELKQFFFDSGIIEPLGGIASEGDIKINLLAHALEIPTDEIHWIGNDEYLVGDEDAFDEVRYLVVNWEDAYELAVNYEENDMMNYIENLADDNEEYDSAIIKLIFDNLNHDDVDSFAIQDIHDCYMKGNVFETHAVEKGEQIGIIAHDFSKTNKDQLDRDKFFDRNTNRKLNSINKSDLDDLCWKIATQFDGYNSGLDYLRAIWGDEQFVIDALVNQNLINWRGIATDSVNISGPLEVLSNWADSEVLNLGNDYYAVEIW